MNGYEFRNVKEDSATLMIYSEIGEDFFGEGLTAKAFADDLKNLGNVREINIRINSIGGNVFDARTMANLLKQHKARKVVDIDGVCGSAATYPACAGDLVRMAEDAIYMIHKPMWGIMGNAVEIRKMADILDTVQSGMVEAYKSKTGLDEAKLNELIDAETWMTPKEAVEFGFADEIGAAMRIAAKADLSKFPQNKLPFEIPEQFKEKIELEVPTPILDAMREQLKMRRQKLKMSDRREALADVER